MRKVDTGDGVASLLQAARADHGHRRQELLRSDPLSVRVTDIAVRWGFFHQSRFAQQYRDEFNELPSVTLRR